MWCCHCDRLLGKCTVIFSGPSKNTKCQNTTPQWGTKYSNRFILMMLLGGGTHALHGSTSPPPPRSVPVSQPTFKFKRFGVQFQVQSFCCSFFFSVADFFSRTKSFIDIEDDPRLVFVRQTLE